MGTRLYRSRRDRMLAGVAGGLAEVWGADPALVRIIWALLVVFTGGVALLIYIVMAIVIPEEEEVYPGGVPMRAAGVGGGISPSGTGRTGGMTPAVLVGGFLVILGGFFLLREFLPALDFDWFWPLILVGLGVVLIVTAMGRGSRVGSSPPPPPPPPPWTPPASEPPPSELPPPPASTTDESPPSPRP
jgi:phage shock protein PspC (stress-responsive transcriptional regulator)